MNRKISASVWAVILTASALAGCSGSGDQASSGGLSQPSPVIPSSSGAEVKATEEKMTYTINIIDTEKQNNDARYDFLKEKFNLDFQMIACSINDVRDKVRLWVAGGDMPEVMWNDIDNVGELRTWVETGGIHELPDMSSYPNLKKIREMQQTDDMFRIDGKDYFMPTMRDSDAVGFRGTTLFIYRKDWARELGLYKDQYSWDEMQELAKAMMEKDPGNNGAGKTIGIASIANQYPACSGLQQYSSNWNNFILRDGQYVWGGALPETVQGLKAAKGLYDSGLIWSEQPAAKQLDGPAKFQAGQVGILFHNLPIGNTEKIVSGLAQTYPGQDVSAMVDVMDVSSPDGTRFMLENMDSWGAISFRADMSDAKIARFLEMMDWMASEDGRMLQRYGLEGVDYTKNGDSIDMLWKKDEQGNFISPYEVNSDRLLSLAQIYEYTKGFSAYEPEDAKNLHERINTYLEKQEDVTVVPVNYALKAFSAPNKDKYDMVTEQRNKIMELIANAQDIEKEYLAWVDSQKDKIDAILQELNEGMPQ